MPTIQSGDLSFSFEAKVGGSLALTEIQDIKTGHKWLTAANPVFGAAIKNGAFIRSNEHPIVDAVVRHSARSFTVWCHLVDPATQLRLQLQLNIHNDGSNSAVHIETRIVNTGAESVFLRLVLPLIQTRIEPPSKK